MFQYRFGSSQVQQNLINSIKRIAYHRPVILGKLKHTWKTLKLGGGTM